MHRGMPMRGHREDRVYTPRKGLGRNQTCPQLDLRFPASRTGSEYISLIIKPLSLSWFVMHTLMQWERSLVDEV